MSTGLLIAILIILVLLLTGTIGPVLIFSLKFGGWTLVGLIVVALIWKLISRLLNPVNDWSASHSIESDFQARIKKRQMLGYDTSDLEEELSKIKESHKRSSGSPEAAVEEERRRFGYTDKTR